MCPHAEAHSKWVFVQAPQEECLGLQRLWEPLTPQCGGGGTSTPKISLLPVSSLWLLYILSYGTSSQVVFRWFSVVVVLLFVSLMWFWEKVSIVFTLMGGKSWPKYFYILMNSCSCCSSHSLSLIGRRTMKGWPGAIFSWSTSFGTTAVATNQSVT